MGWQTIKGDLINMKTTAIVNAANTRLTHGGGVCGAIFSAAGADLLAEACRAIGSCPTGEAVLTPGFNLAAKYIIHTPGPVWSGGGQNEPQLLASCYRRSLELALANNFESIAFPLISAGIYGYPRDLALKKAEETMTQFFQDHETDLEAYLVLRSR
jgi:O-acetyl-ADP-ribose deacetylase (regulator of RNase III)